MDPGATCAPSAEPLPPASEGAPVAIVGVTVLPMGERSALTEHTVVVDGDRIAAVGPADVTEVPEGALEVDGTCRFLMPGLLDMHTHLNFRADLLLYVANGVTTIREMWGSRGRLALRDEVRAGESEGPAPWIFQAGRGIDGDPPTFEGAPFSTNDPEVAAGYVDETFEDGFDYVKVYERLLPDVYQAVVTRARELGIPAVGHVPHMTGADPVISSDQATIEHLDDFYQLMVPPGAQRTWWDGAIDWSAASPLANRIAADGLWNVPTFNVVRAIRTQAERDAFDATTTELRYLPPEYLEFWDRQASGQDPARNEIALSNMQRFLATLVTAGANVMVGTDAGFNRILPGFAIHDELRLMAQAGIELDELLDMLTARPAAFLGLEQELGGIAVGMRADLVLVNGDPRRTLDALEQPDGVVLRGEWFSGVRLQELLEEQARSFEGGAATLLGPAHPHAHGAPDGDLSRSARR